MTKTEFEQIIESNNIDSILDDYLFKGLPFYFRNIPEIHKQMIKALARGLGVPSSDICVVGSARFGFSLSPFSYGRPLNKYSDIDIVVVSATLFDPSWVDLLTTRRTPWFKLRSKTQTYISEHREKHHIYNGWMYPHLVAEALEIGTRWVVAFNALSRIPELSSVTIGGRLYRTWDHVRVYHRRGLRKIREQVIRNRNDLGGEQ